MGAEPPPECDCEVVNTRALQQADTALKSIMDQLVADRRSSDTAFVVTSACGSTNTIAAANAMGEQAIRVPLIHAQYRVFQARYH